MEAQIVTLADLIEDAPEAVSPLTKADARALENWRRNLAALTKIQPGVVELIQDLEIDLIWTFGRDGFLTGQDSQGYWWRGCSVPLLAGREAMKKLELTGTVGCFIWPHNAGQLRACMDIISPKQVIVAVIPDPMTLAVILHCENFSTEITGGRLPFACGWDWSWELARVFRQFPGLPMPQQFVRTAALSDAELQPFINEGQRVISDETNRRGEEIAKLKAKSQGQKKSGMLIAAGSMFNLSDLAPTALIQTLLKDSGELPLPPGEGRGEGDRPDISAPFKISAGSPHPALSRGERGRGETCFLDLDHPLHASPVALASAAEHFAVIVTADIFRQDVPGTIADDAQWITWITRGRIASPDPNAPGDRIILADERWAAGAREAGWSRDRISVAGWPVGFLAEVARPERADLIALPADTQKIEVPPGVKEFSSHVLLWEAIEHELLTDPLAVSTDPVRYLEDRRHRMNLKHDGLNTGIFLEKLIIPAYQQGLARLMLKEKMPLVLLGRGWLEMPEFHEHSAGPMRSAKDLAISLSACSAIVHPMPNPAAHAVDGMNLPVLQPTVCGMRKFISLKTNPPARRMTVLSRAVVDRLILTRAD